MVVFKRVTFVFSNYFSMNENVRRLCVFFNKIHQLMSNGGTLEEVNVFSVLES